MELEIYDAFRSAGVADEKAKAAVESINREIDRRYSLHAQQLATKVDLAEVKAEIMKAIAESQRWNIATMFAAVGLFAAISKMWS